MNMPVGRGYKLNPNQEKCFALVNIINSVPQQFATTDYKEGKGYFVWTTEKNYYPTNQVEWENAVEYFEQIKATVERVAKYDAIRSERIANIRSKLTEEEQYALNCHPNQDEVKKNAYVKLGQDADFVKSTFNWY